MSDTLSAAGERAAMGGYMPQFSEFANFAYRELVADKLDWIRIADPDAKKRDDIQYATATLVHAYQVKWTIAEDVISFIDFRNLLLGLALSWKNLRAKYQPQHKQVIGHLLTNKVLHTVFLGKELGSLGANMSSVSLVSVVLMSIAEIDHGFYAQAQRLGMRGFGCRRKNPVSFHLNP